MESSSLDTLERCVHKIFEKETIAQLNSMTILSWDDNFTYQSMTPSLRGWTSTSLEV
jgi:hypothetical protein